MTTAVILAAGMGTRLKELGKEIPKGFLRLGEKTIIEESLEKLKKTGITRVIIVTGHLREFYDDLAARLNAETESGNFISTLCNAEYASSGSMYSLYKARRLVEESGQGREESFLLLESDLVYEARALKIAAEYPGESVVLLSGPTNSGDEVWAGAPGGNLRRLTKKLEELQGEPLGELVGISKIGPGLFRAMLEEAEYLFHRSLKVEYEAALTAAAARVTVPCGLIPDLVWTEIDDESHLDRARREVYPRL